MSIFQEAIVSEHRNEQIPAEHDWFEGLLGEWNMSWHYCVGRPDEGTSYGEWIFSRVLDGTGIQDLFIIPTREEQAKTGAPFAEFGTTLRTYNPANGNWEIYYTNVSKNLCEYTRLTANKIGDSIELLEKEGKMKWTFLEIKENEFHWQCQLLQEDGSWRVEVDCHATRK